ncbi:MAG TPA: hypothetical protein VFD19_02830, partial [Clostridia bacterium]|nr:hypothetical protein [Clostridia bacterium]
MLLKLKKQFQWLVDQYKREYVVSVFCISINYLIALAPPWFAGYLADRILNLDLTVESLLIFIALLLALTALFYASGFIWSYYLVKAYDVAELMAR